METNEPIRTPTLRRRRRSKLQIFKEAYLPTLIMITTAVLVLVFVIGGLVKNNPNKNLSTGHSGSTATSSTTGANTSPTDSLPPSTVDQALIQEASYLLEQAAILANDYDYAGAVTLLESFSGLKSDFPELTAAINRYQAADDEMVAWDSSDVYDLSFHVLIADPQRAFTDAVYSNSYRMNFITVTEFCNILDELYAGGYILVDLEDFYSLEYSSTLGDYVYVEKQLRLPSGKKPIMLTELSASYYGYMQTGAQDGMADGFASRLAFDGKQFYNELIHADGSVSTGAYDMVPLLEEFIAEHPDFSYRGARAVISFAGYDRILGYRVNDAALSANMLQVERDSLKATVDALKAAGYKLGCYTYNNVNYLNMSAEAIFDDISMWMDKVAPWVGEVDIMVFAREGDIIGTQDPYSGTSKFNVLYNAGFRFFLGAGDTPWSQVAERYVRHDRLMVTGGYLVSKANLYETLFDATAVLDPIRY